MKPIIVLVTPQLGENIGMVARAMLNCGLTDLRLVAPRDGWPSIPAERAASGALEKGVTVSVYETTEQAVADCHYVAATTARLRDLVKRVETEHTLAKEMNARLAQKQNCAVLFGPERSGLTNEDIALSHAVVTFPLNPDFTSLNLSQAVLIIAHSWHSYCREDQKNFADAGSPPAPQADFQNFMKRLLDDLDERGFFRSEGLRPTLERNLTSLFVRAEMTEQELNTLNGVIRSLKLPKQS